MLNNNISSKQIPLFPNNTIILLSIVRCLLSLKKEEDSIYTKKGVPNGTPL